MTCSAQSRAKLKNTHPLHYLNGDVRSDARSRHKQERNKNRFTHNHLTHSGVHAVNGATDLEAPNLPNPGVRTVTRSLTTRYPTAPAASNLSAERRNTHKSMLGRATGHATPTGVDGGRTRQLKHTHLNLYTPVLLGCKR